MTMAESAVRHDIQLAGVLEHPQIMFVLWAVHTRFCVSLDDFTHHFGEELPAEHLIAAVELYGLLERREEELVLSDQGSELLSSTLPQQYASHKISTADAARPQGRISELQGLGFDNPPILSNYSAEPKYDLQTVVSLIGVRPMILYGWEQQLGIPWVHRPGDESGLGRRRYAERDLVALLWLREQIFQGRAPTDAAARLHAAQAGVHFFQDRALTGAVAPLGAAPASVRLPEANLQQIGQAPSSRKETGLARKTTRILVSHSRNDLAFAFRLVSDLRAAGADVHVIGNLLADHDDLRRIADELARCEWVIVVLTPSSLQSPLVAAVVNLGLALADGGSLVKGVIPIVTEPIDPREIPPLWAGLHRYDASVDYGSAVASLKGVLGLLVQSDG